MTAIERLFEYLEYKGVKPTAFEKESGIANGYLSKAKSRESSLGRKVIDKIMTKAPDLNEEWLLIGAGDMIKETDNLNNNTKNLLKMEQKIESLEREISLLNELLQSKNEMIEMLKMRSGEITNKQTGT